MFGFKRPPHEPSAAERTTEREQQIDRIDQAVAWARANGDMEQADQLLDYRLRLRPAAPGQLRARINELETKETPHA